MSLNTTRLYKVLRKAEDAFWGAVADALPEIKSGDFPPDAQFDFEEAMKDAIQTWYEGNQTSDKSASGLIRNLENRIARLEKTPRTAGWEPGSEANITIRDFRDYHQDVEEVLDTFEREDGVVYALIELEDETYQVVRSEDGIGDWEDFGSHDLYRYSRAQDEFERLVKDFGGRLASQSRQSSVNKYARTIPRPPQNRSLIDIKRATSISDKALDNEYGYGLSKPNSFGYEANKYSSLYALDAIMNNLETVLSNPKDKKLVEIVSDAVHDGWSYAAYNVDDPRYQTQPEKRDNRIALADASYRSLSEGEKEKDRVIARALIMTVYMAEKR